MRAQTSLLLAAVVSCCLVGLCSADSERPAAKASFFEAFGPGWTARWHYATARKYIGRFAVVKPPGFQDTAIQMQEPNQYYGMTALLDEPLHPKDGLVVQYEVKFAEGHKCGGAYLKLLSAPADGTALVPEKLKPKTPFTVMFGPDKCGPDTRVHVILHISHPVTGNVSEHHLMSAPEPQEDLLSHVYALLLHNNGMYKVLIDGVEEAAGQLLTADFSPKLQPPEIIPDPEDVKPEDWIEEEMMDDPSVHKPDDWDDRRMIADPHVTKPDGWLDHELPEVPDPDAVKPEGWDESSQGVWLPPPIKNPACVGAPGCGPWKAPVVSNPKYKGPWIAPQVKNPKYKGPWKQREIPNPAYFKVDNPLELLAPVAAVAFELWTTDKGYTFDSVMLGSGEAGIAAAAAYMRDTWRPRNHAEKAAFMAAERSKSRPAGLRHLATNKLRDIIEAKALRSIRPRFDGLVWMMQEHPELGWVIVVAPAMMVVALILDRRQRSKRVQLEGPEEEEEGPEPELEFDEAEVKRLSKHAATMQKQRQSGGGAATGSQQQQHLQQQQQQQSEERIQQQEGIDGDSGGSEGEESSGEEKPAVEEPKVRRRAASRRA